MHTCLAKRYYYGYIQVEKESIATSGPGGPDSPIGPAGPASPINPFIFLHLPCDKRITRFKVKTAHSSAL